MGMGGLGGGDGLPQFCFQVVKLNEFVLINMGQGHNNGMFHLGSGICE